MNIEQFAKRPPYIQFGYEDLEDRAASIENGRYCTKPVAMVYITPPGSKDQIPRVATEWFAQIEDAASRRVDNAYPFDWIQGFKNQFAAWNNQEELPPDGTAIKTWPVLSPAERTTILQANVRTVEDLAAANEATLTLIGMGARALKQKAIDWLASANDIGKVAQELSALRAENEQTKALLADALDTIKSLKAELPKRGRPRNEDREAA